MEILSNDKRFSKISEIIQKTGGLGDDLNDSNHKVTFFAPTNEALEKLHELMKRGKSSSEYGKYEMEMPKMEEILKYHMVKERICVKELYDGQLLESKLVCKELGEKMNQKIRVKRVLGSVYLNCFTRIEEVNWKVSNGAVYAVDWVLLPPCNAFNVLFNIPFIASTFTSAIQVCGLEKELKNEKGLTVMVPTDAAWKQMNFTDLIYLFSPLGRCDLKKVLEYHICPELTYACDMIEEKEISIPTLLKKEEIKVKAISRVQERRSEKECPNQYLFVINRGEASIKCTDTITKNGNVHFINSVLIPESVVLPSKRGGKSSSYEGGFY